MDTDLVMTYMLALIVLKSSLNQDIVFLKERISKIKLTQY